LQVDGLLEILCPQIDIAGLLVRSAARRERSEETAWQKQQRAAGGAASVEEDLCKETSRGARGKAVSRSHERASERAKARLFGT